MKLTLPAAGLLPTLVAGLLAAFTGIAGATAPAYNPDDLLLGFRASGGTGSPQDYLVNLGPVTSLPTNAVKQFTQIGNTGADLASIFGAGWSATGSKVFWSLAATPGSDNAAGDVARTLYATSPETTPGLAAPALLTANYAEQSGPSNKIAALGGAYVQNAGVPNTLTSGTAITQSVTDANSYASFQTGSSSYSYFSSTVEGSLANGVAGSVLDLYKLVPTATPQAGSFIGRFILDSNGVPTFVPAALIGQSTLQLAKASDTVYDDVSGGSYVVTVTRSGDTTSAASVTLSTSDGSASAGTDYTTVSQTVTFGINEVSKTVSIPVANLGFKADRTFNITLSNPDSLNALGSTSTEVVTISTAPEASVVQFASASYSVNQGATTVSVNLVRTGGNSPVTVTLTTADGAADGSSIGDAAAGHDYTALNGAQVTIGANQTTASQSITLTPQAGAQPNKAFNVTLGGAGTGLSIGTTGTTTVDIIADDTVKPVVKITAPAAATLANGSLAGSIPIGGTATDNKGVAHVLWSLNGSAFADSSLSSAGAATTAWNASLTPVGGANTLQVEAVDFKGNTSTVVSLSFTYVVKGSLAVNITGPGTVTGKLTGNAYQLGKSYTLTAVPGGAAGLNIFNGWTGPGITGTPAAAQAKLTFVYTPALAAPGAALVASFLTNPFTSSIIGGFNGLVKTDTANHVVPANENTGLVTFTVTNSGSFSGTLKIDGLALPLTGQFDNTGHAVFGANRTPTVAVVRTGKPSLVLENVVLDIAPAGSHRITGSIGEQYRSSTLPWSTFSADRAAAFTAASGNSSLLSGYLANKGYYTVVIPAQGQPAGSDLTAVDYPQGDGIGSLTVAASGVVTLAATLADGTAVSATAPLSIGLSAPLFAQLYTAKTGSFGGQITLDKSNANHDLSGTGFTWFKPYVGGQVYPYGWNEGVITSLYGASYAAPSGTSAVPGLTPAAAATANAEIAFSLNTPSTGFADVTKNLNISATNVVTKQGSPADPSYTLAITAATGKFSGTFVAGDGTKPAYSGIIFSKTVSGHPSAYNGGYGFFLTPTPKVIDGTGQSGSVKLGPN